MVTVTKQFTDIEDVLHFIDTEAGYVTMNDKFKVEVTLVNRKFRVTIETESD